MTGSNSPEPFISVVVCTRDRPADLARCLPTILANDYPSFELIVVDQSTSNASEQIISALADPRLVHLRLTAPGKARAENAALARSKGEIIAFTDDDCEVPTNWLRRASSLLANEPDAGIVYGAVVAAPHNPAEMHVPTFLPSRYRKVRGRWIRYPRDAGLGANEAVRRSVFDNLGGFDEWVGPGSPFRSGDDMELAYRATWKGYSLVQDPENVIIHWGMRPYASGAAARAWHNNYYGMGAIHARHVRRGNWVAALLYLCQVWWAIELVIPRLLQGNKNLGIRRVLYLLLGAVKGAMSPLSFKLPGDAASRPVELTRRPAETRAER